MTDFTHNIVLTPSSTDVYATSVRVEFPELLSCSSSGKPITVYGQICKLPGNDTVGISYNVYLQHADTNKGYGRVAHQARLECARNELRYDALLCTVRPDNAAQLRILDTEGWECMGMVSDVLLYKRELRES